MFVYGCVCFQKSKDHLRISTVRVPSVFDFRNVVRVCSVVARCMFSNFALGVIFGFDTAENKPLKVRAQVFQCEIATRFSEDMLVACLQFCGEFRMYTVMR